MPRKVHPLVPLGAVVAVLAALLPVVSATASPAPSPVTKVLTIVEENHSLAQMQSGMPYAFAQATTYGYATNWTALTHPSLPNYIGIVSGSTQGVTDNNPPSSHPLAGPTVFGQAIAAGRTAATYAEGMTSNCMLTNTGRYAVKHNPWAYFTAERSQCGTDDVPTTRLAADISAGALPNVGMVVPDLCHDAHDCPLATADAWFENLMTQVYAGPDWKSGHLAVVLTADEDDKASGNKVLTVVMHPSLAGKVVTTPLTHYSLTRFYADVAGVGRLNAAAAAPDMAAAFGLAVAGAAPAPAPTTTTALAPTTTTKAPVPAPTTTTKAPVPAPTTTTKAPAPAPTTTTKAPAPTTTSAAPVPAPITTTTTPAPITTTTAPVPAPTTTSALPARSEQQAAVVNGWGPVVAGDEFDYTGLPSPAKWNLYNSAGHRGEGLRRSSAWNVDGRWPR